jgi:hypothetical protein
MDALEKVRGVEPRWVQSEEQVHFLQTFADYLAATHVDRRPAKTKLNENIAIPNSSPI